MSPARRSAPNVSPAAGGPAGGSAGEAADRPQTVSQLSRRIARLLEDQIGRVWVEGEISNLRIPRSGHAYFVLKDADAAINCVCFRGRLSALKVDLRDGDRVEVRGNAAAYTARSEYQILVDSVRPAGLGELMRRFIELREKLKAEGLFEPERKRALPALPRTVGIVTSATGAALQDMLHVLQRRASGLTILVSPCAVQGAAAAREIVAAIERLNRDGRSEVVIVGRGGGSIEDLWAFNEEPVVRAVAASAIPVISGVGHETDTTLTDFAADLRAPTPSAAAEIVTAGYARFIETLRKAERQLNREIGMILARKRREVEALRSSWGLRRPLDQLREAAQEFDELGARLERSISDGLKARREGLREARYRLGLASPALRVQRARAEAGHLKLRLERASMVALRQNRQRLERLSEQLVALGPQGVLNRGYSLITTADGRRVVTGPEQAKPGQSLKVHSAGGTWKATPLPPGDELFDSL